MISSVVTVYYYNNYYYYYYYYYYSGMTRESYIEAVINGINKGLETITTQEITVR